MKKEKKKKKTGKKKGNEEERFKKWGRKGERRGIEEGRKRHEEPQEAEGAVAGLPGSGESFAPSRHWSAGEHSENNKTHS